MRDRRPDVGEPEALRPMDGLVGFLARGHDADRHRIEPRVAQPPQSDRRRAVRFEMDRSEPRPFADRDDRFFDDADGEERLALARTPERDDGAAALEVPRRRIRKLLRRRTERGGFRW